MLTSKQRAYLKSVAQTIEPVYQIGKENLTDAIIAGINEALSKREIVKITVLKSTEYTPEEFLAELASKLKAEPVTAIGNRIILYRKSNKPNVKHIELP